MNFMLHDKINNAENFTYGELIKSDLAIRHNIENIPNELIWGNLIDLAVNILQPVRNQFGPIRINSGYRSPKLNSLAKGSPTSTHVFGLAADIEPFDKNIKLIDIFEFICTKLEFYELIAEYFPGGWVHVAFNKDDNMKMIKLKDNNHNYTRVTLDYVKSKYR